jgi:hypothetical protein
MFNPGTFLTYSFGYQKAHIANSYVPVWAFYISPLLSTNGKETIMRKMLSLFLAAATLIVAMGGTAGASLISYTDSLTTDGYLEGDMGSLTLSQFKPGLGTLTSVTLILSDYFSWAAQIVNNGTTTSRLTRTLDQNIAIQEGSTTLLSDSHSSIATWTVAPRQTVTTASTSSTPNTLQMVLTGSDLAHFIGSGNLIYNVFADQNETVSSRGGNSSFSPTHLATANATITYNFTPTPIMPALPLFFSGLTGLMLVRRRMHL